MKIGSLITLSLVFSCSAFAQAEDNKKAEAKPNMNKAEADNLLKEISKSFENLPKAERIKYLKMRNEAAKLFQNKRIFETLDLVRKMDEIFKNDPQALVLKGACYVEIRDFASARESFDQAVKVVGPKYNILFNLAEIDFVTNKWSDALKLFETIKPDIPDRDIGMKRLVDFKIMLCHIRLADKAENEDEKKKHEQVIAELTNQQGFMDDSPYYYYANAAYNYYKGDVSAADQWLAKGRRVYQLSPAHIASWEDTLVEFGYIKSYFGDEEAAEDK